VSAGILKATLLAWVAVLIDVVKPSLVPSRKVARPTLVVVPRVRPPLPWIVKVELSVEAPFKLIAPVPVLKVVLPVWVMLPPKVAVPVPTVKVLLPVTEVLPPKVTAPLPVLKVPVEPD
jgi:hypothetical protein